MRLLETLLLVVVANVAIIIEARTLLESVQQEAASGGNSLGDEPTIGLKGAEKVMGVFVEKAELVQIFRKEMYHKLSTLEVLIEMSKLNRDEKTALGRVVSQLKSTYDDLDFLLNEFVPSETDLREILDSFQLEEMSSSSSSQAEGEISEFKRHISPKRNQVNRYHKIPVIRTG
jgi:hypothetical protein